MSPSRRLNHPSRSTRTRPNDAPYRHGDMMNRHGTGTTNDLDTAYVPDTETGPGRRRGPGILNGQISMEKVVGIGVLSVGMDVGMDAG